MHLAQNTISLKFERVKCQPGKSSRSTHRPGPRPRQNAYFQISTEIHGWMAKKTSVQIAGTELHVISYAGLVFGNNIVYSI